MARETIVVMGVTGSGKSTLGRMLAQALGRPFHDGDDYHPPSNREKLRHDVPLEDEDRLPWLRVLADGIRRWNADGGAVLACSALKERYRAILREGGPVLFVHVVGSQTLIASRLRRRSHELVRNFDAILSHQFRDLEPPQDAITVTTEEKPEEMLRQALSALAERGIVPNPPGDSRVSGEGAR